MNILLYTSVLSLICVLNLHAQLHINEFMSSNGSTVSDQDGDYSDWVEIYNSGDQTINLAGYGLSDRLNNLGKWRFPNVSIPGKSYLLVFASGKNRLGSELHTSYSIDKEGESLVLSDNTGKILDTTPPVELGPDISYGCYPDGSPGKFILSSPTPAGSNVIPAIEDFEFSRPSGFYEEGFNLEINASGPAGIKIFYTTNGNDPDPQSEEYQSAIFLRPSDELENNEIIYIPTNSIPHSQGYEWMQPGEDIFKAHAIKARAFLGDIPVSSIITATYFIDENVHERFDLPVFSLVIPEESLFDYEIGLFVPGITFDNSPSPANPWSVGNFDNTGDDWERQAEIFLFDPDNQEKFQQGLGIRIHGGGSRSFPQKSLRLYARGEYGKSHFIHPFFEGDTLDTFKRLILRNSGQDFVNAMLRDGISSLLTQDIDIETPGYRPSVLFINGAYWGITNIRERLDNHHFLIREGVSEDNLDLLEFEGYLIEEGENQHYLDMLSFIRNNSLEDESNYNTVAEMMDVDNFIDYYIVKKYIAVYDWPGNNIKYWRDRSVNGKWRWISYDNDDAFKNIEFNSYDHLTDSTDQQWPNPLWSTELFRHLIKNHTFKNQFISKVRFHLENTFHPENTVPVALEASNKIADEIPHNITRWKYPSSYDKWEDEVDIILDFLEKRPCVFWNMSLKFFGKDPKEHLINYCIDNSVEADVEPIFKIYPNPAKGRYFVELNPDIQLETLKVVDMRGNMVQSVALENTDFIRQVEFSDNLIPGMYFVHGISSDGTKFVSKLVIQR